MPGKLPHDEDMLNLPLYPPQRHWPGRWLLSRPVAV